MAEEQKILSGSLPDSFRDRLKRLWNRFFRFSVLKHLLTLLCFPGAMLLYLFRIRILINCKTSGIGHLAMEPAWFIARKTLYKKRFKKKFFVLLINESEVANRCLAEMFKSNFCQFYSKTINWMLEQVARYEFISVDIGVAPPIGTPLDRNFTIQRNQRHAVMMKDTQAYRNRYSKSFVQLPDKILKKGRDNLEILGIGKNDWFVCLHAGEVTTDSIWNYELFRRNQVGDYFDLIEYITGIGGKVVRMGHQKVPAVTQKVPIIDYPRSSVWSDWMDIYLIHECKYFIGCQSGLQLVAVILGKPLLLTNIIPWPMVNGYDGDIYLPKLIRLKETGDYISIREYLDNELHLAQFTMPDRFEVVPNSGEDLINAAKEMEEYLKNGLPEEDDLQRLWKSFFPSGSQCQCSDVRVSASFLRKYEDVLFRV